MSKENSSKVSSEIKLNLLCCGFLRRYFKKRNVNTNPKDVARIVTTFLLVKWEWDFCFDAKSRNVDKEEPVHYITNNGKTVKCDHDYHCYCWFRISNTPMKPNSGIYDIKIKIDQIVHRFGNCIGITRNSSDKLGESCVGSTWARGVDFLTWSSEKDSSRLDWLSNGLFLSWGNEKNNIFVLNQFKYKSNNKYYKDGLPPISSADIIIMQYDSYMRTLSFKKENDNKLDALVENLPANTTFYWFAGHVGYKMSMTVID